MLKRNGVADAATRITPSWSYWCAHTNIRTSCPALIQPAIENLAGFAGAVYAGAQGTLPPSALAVFGTIESDRVPQRDDVTHLSAGYRNMMTLQEVTTV